MQKNLQQPSQSDTFVCVYSVYVLGPLDGTRSRQGIFKVVNVYSEGYFKSQRNQIDTAEHAAKNRRTEMGRK